MRLMLAVENGILERRYHPKNIVKNHSEIERYNRTLDEESLQTGHYIDDLVANKV